MFARLRPHLTYANVIATLALFIALGGSAVAARSLFSGRLLAARSVPGTKIVRNSLTKTEVRESSLGKVPNADKIDSLDSKQLLRSDGKAVDADLLDGLDSGAFLRSDGTAVNASKLGGQDASSYRLTCASSQRLFAGVCMETSARGATTFASASAACGGSGGRLATLAELDGFRQQPTIQLGSAPDVPEWSGTPSKPNAVQTSVEWWVIDDNGEVTSRLASDGGTPFRCAFTPSG